MKNKKLMYIIIPVGIAIVILLTIVCFLALSGTSKNIFKHSINNLFKFIENNEERYTTVKGKMDFSANIESDDEEIQALNNLLDEANISLGVEADTTNMIVNENINITYNNESLLNAILVLQDQKGYICLPDWLDKYIELSEDEIEYSDLTSYFNKTATLDQNKLIKAIQEELTKEVLNQEIVKENTAINLDGKSTKVKASTLSLKGEQINTFTINILNNLKANENFQNSLGDFKDDVLVIIDDMIQNIDETENMEYIFTIYTKGIFNKFVGLSLKCIDNEYNETTGLDIVKHNDNKYEFVSYNKHDDEIEEDFKLIIEDKKENRKKGIMTITAIAEEDEFVLTYNYEKKDNQTIFEISTEIEGVGIVISGNIEKNGENYKGNIVATITEQNIGKFNLNCAYDFTYNTEIQKVDVGNAVLIDELTDDEQEEFMTNLQNSPLYQILEQSNLINNVITTTDNKTEVNLGEYKVKYSVPINFDASNYNSDDMKMYMDDNYNSVYVYIDENNIDTYMNNLEDDYILTSALYKNQKITDEKKYTVNDNEYRFRTITYEDEYGSYINLYFAYELDDEYYYAVEVETEGENISMDIIKYFLDIIVEK